MVDVKNKYSWRLVGPWYRKNSVGGGKGFSGRPIIQKYASSDFINDFIKDPQRSLKYLCEDFIDRPSGNIFNQVTETNQNGDTVKLFLDNHNRFYLVVCELHCHAPGFPAVERDKVCEAGFVVRKTTARYPIAMQPTFNKFYARKKYYIDELQKYKSSLATLKARQQNGETNPLLKQRIKTNTNKVTELDEQLKDTEQKIQSLLDSPGVTIEISGWMNTEHKGIGNWEVLTDVGPQEIDEDIFQLYPLFADKESDPNHSSGHQSIYFGLIPTNRSDVDEEGYARFDDNSLYEIRCFVRKHRDVCPKKTSRNDCHGELVWSEPTESYKLASPFDLDGTSHRPINIVLPDTNALKQLSARRPFGSASNVRMILPANSELNFVSDGLDTGGMTKKANAFQQICFLSIPLITIVALFVLSLFLPIVVFIMQLWFLLRLKFCIPPGVNFDADLAADLQLYGPEFEANLEAAIDESGVVSLGGTDYANTADIIDAIAASMATKENNFGAEMAGKYKEFFTSNFDDMAGVTLDMATDFTADPADSALGAELPTPKNGLIYFEKVTA